MERYSECELTRRSDRLVAIAGLAHYLEVTGQSQSQYIAGLWKQGIEDQLVWRVSLPMPRPKELRAPSWSWGAIDGPVENVITTRPRLEGCARTIKVVNIGDPRDRGIHLLHDTTVCSLRLRGWLIPCRFRAESDHSDNASIDSALFHATFRKDAINGNDYYDDDMFCAPTHVTKHAQFHPLTPVGPSSSTSRGRLGLEGLDLQSTGTKGVFRRLGTFKATLTNPYGRNSSGRAAGMFAEHWNSLDLDRFFPDRDTDMLEVASHFYHEYCPDDDNCAPIGNFIFTII